MRRFEQPRFPSPWQHSCARREKSKVQGWLPQSLFNITSTVYWSLTWLHSLLFAFRFAVADTTALVVLFNDKIIDVVTVTVLATFLSILSSITQSLSLSLPLSPLIHDVAVAVTVVFDDAVAVKVVFNGVVVVIRLIR